jgi:hypothetical protein
LIGGNGGYKPLCCFADTSYYIEGLLHNVPDDEYVGDYQDIFLNILKCLYKDERS